MKAIKFQDEIPSIQIDNFKDDYVVVNDDLNARRY